jgi:hypothetical protein
MWRGLQTQLMQEWVKWSLKNSQVVLRELKAMHKSLRQ